MPLITSALRTATLAANLPGSCARVARWTTTPWVASHSMSAANRDSVGSTSVPHTPVEQHIDGSKISTFAIPLSSHRCRQMV